MVTENQATFPSFQFPNTTQIPNEVFDTLLPQLSGGELKVLLYICRRTFGFRKDSDSISLTQISKGITTKAGKVLDQGTGLSKRQVQRALRVLENRKVILVKRNVDETGLHEINTYRLNVRGGDMLSPPVETPVSGGVGTPMSPGVETPVSTTKQREQNKEEQKKAYDDAVAQALKNFGITNDAATALAKQYPAAYIWQKLALTQELVTSGSCLVSQNPAGWLRRAIEENYSPPRNTKRNQQPSGTNQRERRRVDTEPGGQQAPTKAPQPPQNVSTVRTEPEKPSRENDATWHKTVEHLGEVLPRGEAETRLTGTMLLQTTDTTAVIFVPNPNLRVWLERRLYGQISKAIKAVVGKDLDLQFVTNHR
jgi:phage replication O-like protein O